MIPLLLLFCFFVFLFAIFVNRIQLFGIITRTSFLQAEKRKQIPWSIGSHLAKIKSALMGSALCRFNHFDCKTCFHHPFFIFNFLSFSILNSLFNKINSLVHNLLHQSINTVNYTFDKEMIRKEKMSFISNHRENNGKRYMLYQIIRKIWETDEFFNQIK